MTLARGFMGIQGDEKQEVVTGDCLNAVRMMTKAGIRFDAMVTDPPYGVGSYDWGIPPKEAWETFLKAMKPGGLALVTGNPKTFHRQTTWMEDVGWEIQDCLMWVFAHGYTNKIGEASWAVHKTLLGKKAEIQRGHYAKDSLQWRTWGAKLKPGWEPIILAQAPGEPTMAKNLISNGVGALNFNPDPMVGQLKLFEGSNQPEYPPSNLIMDDEARQMLAAENSGHEVLRMFFHRNVSMKERNAGMPIDKPNDHPTVKAIGLMRWLISLITPPGGLLLDPYVGSGSTGCAAAMEDVQFVGIDQDPEYIEIARRRIAWWAGVKAKYDKDTPGLFIPKSHIVNSRAMTSKSPSGVCRNGHRVTPANTYYRPDGRKECKTCKRMSRKKIRFDRPQG